MNVFIIEDEQPAIDNLIRLLNTIDPEIQVVGKAHSVQKAVEWISNTSETVDLYFMDIQLGDGLSFHLFDKVALQSPVIFITAYHQYAIEAFKNNGIDYLLKPLQKEALEASLNKLDRLKAQWSRPTALPWQELQQSLMQIQQKSYKTRFMVKVGEHIRSVGTETIHAFYADGRTVYLLTEQYAKYIVDYKLEALEGMLDPKDFFRINRSYILHIQAIKEVLVYSGSRLKVILPQPWPEEIIVSREKVNDFKAWFDGA